MGCHSHSSGMFVYSAYIRVGRYITVRLERDGLALGPGVLTFINQPPRDE